MKFVDLELARRLELAGHPDCISEGNDATSLVELKRPGDVHINVGGGIAEFRGVNSPVTQAEGLGLNGPVSEEDMERMEKFYRCRGSAVFIEVCPMADPGFIEMLGKRGYRVLEFSNMLIREIDPLEKFPQIPPGITIRQAEPSEIPPLRRNRLSRFCRSLLANRRFNQHNSGIFPPAQVWFRTWSGSTANPSAEEPSEFERESPAFSQSATSTNIAGAARQAAPIPQRASKQAAQPVANSDEHHAAVERLATQSRAPGLSRRLHPNQIHSRVELICESSPGNRSRQLNRFVDDRVISDFVNQAAIERFCGVESSARYQHLEARLRPINRGNRCVPPQPVMMPRLPPGWANTVSRDAIRAWHASARSSPPPTQYPRIAATMGFDEFATARITLWP